MLLGMFVTRKVDRDLQVRHLPNATPRLATSGLPLEAVPGAKLESGLDWPGSGLAEAGRRAEQMLAARSFRAPAVDSRAMSAV
jgi:hypothetical protein